MPNNFDAFSETSKNIIFTAQEEMDRFGDKQIQTKHILLGILKQDKSIAQMILNHFGITYSTVLQLAKESSSSKVTEEKPQKTKKDVISIEILTQKTQDAIKYGAQKSVEMGHTIIDSEHILYGIMQFKDSSAKELLEKLNVYPKDILDHMKDLLKKTFKKPRERGGTAIVTPPRKKEDVQKLLGGIHGVLIGLFNGDMEGADINYEQNFSDDNQKNPQKKFGKNSQKEEYRTPAIDYFCEDLSKKAKKGLIEPIIGRKKEIQRCIQILCRKTKNNPILLGDPGVGKTAIAEGLAIRVENGQIPSPLFQKRIMALSVSNLVAGTKYRGEFEERIKNIIDEASIPENNIIIFIDELHTIIGAGSSEGTLDAANILKPALSRGVIQVIGATTHDEHQKYIEKDAALVRRFQPIEVDEPTISESQEILNGVAQGLEPFHNTCIMPSAVEAAVKLSDRYIPEKFLPDKAIDLLDEACAAKSTANDKQIKKIQTIYKKIQELEKKKEAAVLSQNYDQAGTIHKKIISYKEEITSYKKQKFDRKKAPKINQKDIAEVIHRITGIPTKNLKEQDITSLKNIESNIQKNIVGQDKAISVIAKSIRKSRLGLQDPKRPLGCFLFLGPTGVGKTEVVKKLAQEVFHDEKSLIKLDMSEFSSGHTASRLVGASAGYIGHESGGDLTEKVRKKPYSIILFDEIEKAHKEVHNLLLQILDEGILTDGKGRKINFKNCIIILTSNIGAKRFQKEANSIGFGDTKESLSQHDQDFKQACTDVQKDLKQSFSPEFLNRLDATVIFHPLDRNSIKKIVKLKIREIEERLTSKNITFQLSGSTINALTKIAYKPEMGAREIRRVLIERLEDPLVEEILHEKIKDNQRIKITHNPKEKKCEFSVIEKAD